ncbi:conserved hypothetical protein [Candidatus Sulfopaludibacter sp. SbA3]|nr:conserved hypothetical protein [Candidatus Sulfopaludibacter sp. SbA3]
MAVCSSLQDCIREAYGVGDAQILGQTWLKPDRYDIVAKMPLEARQNQRPAMLQALLAERFKLAVHREIREMPVYALVVAKGGLKIQPVEAGSGGLTGGSGKLMAKAVPLSRLAGYLAGPRLQLGHPVIDRTGISESFSFTLEYTPEDLFAALQEQLGLKLEPSKGMVDVIIVDHAEKPSEN